MQEATSVHLLLLALVAFIAYSNTFHVPFVFDDNSSIVDNPVIKDLSAFLSGAGYAYNPRRFVGYLSFALNYKLGGLNVAGYHAVNLAIHIINAWLVYLLVRVALRTPFFAVSSFGFRVSGSETSNKLETRNFVPLFAALLFVAHPVQTQAVTYVVQRLASLATLFFLLSLVLYLKARLAFRGNEEQEAGSGEFKPQNSKIQYLPFAFLALSLISAVLAMRTKEIAATLPLVLLLCEFSFFGTGGRKKLLFLVPILLTVLIIPLGMFHTGKPLGELLSDVSEMARESRTISRGDYLLTQFSVIVTYIRLLFLPLNQNLDYDYPVSHSLLEPRVLLSFVFLTALFGLALYLYRRSGKPGLGNRDSETKTPTSDFRIPNPELRLVAFGIIWFFITLAVESSVIPISDVIFEHRLYLPSVGAFIALATAGELFFRWKPVYWYAALATTAILSIFTWQRNFVWQDPVTLWTDVMNKSPRKYRAYSNLGFALNQEGKVDEAIESLQAALRLNPVNARSHNTIGSAYRKKGLKDLALQHFLAAVQLDPALADAHSNLGAAYGEMGLIDLAISHLEIAVNQNAGAADAHSNLGTAYAIKGVTEKAIEHFQTAIALNPDSPDFHLNLANVFAQKGWNDKEARERNIAISLQRR